MQNVSFETLKSVISAYQSLMSQLSDRVTKLMAEASGKPVEPKDSKHTELLRLFYEYSSDLMARRLQENNRQVPLTSEQDFNGFVSILLEDAMPSEELFAKGVEEIEVRRVVLDALKENFLKVAADPSEPNDRQYEKHTRIVRIITQMCREYNKKPQELIDNPKTADNLIRRLYPEEELRETLLLPVNSYFDEDELLARLIRPMLESTTRSFLASSEQEMSEAEIEELVQEAMREAKTELIPKYLPHLKQTQENFTAAFEKEFIRIYHTTETVSV